MQQPKGTKFVALCTAALTGAGAFALVAPQAAFAAQNLGIGTDVSVAGTAPTATVAATQLVSVGEGQTTLAGNYKLKVSPVSGTVTVKVKNNGTLAAGEASVTAALTANAAGEIDLVGNAAGTEDFLANGTTAADQIQLEAIGSATVRIQAFRDIAGDGFTQDDHFSNEKTVSFVDPASISLGVELASTTYAQGDAVKAEISTTSVTDPSGLAAAAGSTSTGSTGKVYVQWFKDGASYLITPASWNPTTKKLEATLPAGAAAGQAAAGNYTAFAFVDVAGASKYTKNFTVVDFAVSAVVVAGVKTTNVTDTSAVKVRVGAQVASYSAKVTTTRPDKSNIPVTFNLSAFASVPAGKLLVDGKDATLAGAVFVKLTDADGVARLDVTNLSALAGESYTVNAKVGATAAPAATGTYTAAAAAAIVVDPVVQTASLGGSASIRGKVTDQWGEAYSTNVKLKFLDDAGNNSFVSDLAAVNGGVATYTVTDTKKAESSTDVIAVSATDGLGNAINGIAAVNATIKWSQFVSAGSLSIAAGTELATTTSTTFAGTATIDTVGTVSTADDGEIVKLEASVFATNGAPLGGAPVVWGGSEGVSLSATANATSTDAFTTTATVGADAAGKSVVYARFTKTGKALISANVGGLSKTFEVVVAHSAAAGTTVTDGGSTFSATARHLVIAEAEVKAKPGEFKTLRLVVTDRYGNGVANVPVRITATGVGRFANGERTATRISDKDGVVELEVLAGLTESGVLNITARLAGDLTVGANDPVECDDPAGTVAGTSVLGAKTGNCEATAKVTFATVIVKVKPVLSTKSQTVKVNTKVKFTGKGAAGDKVSLYYRYSTKSKWALSKLTAEVGEKGTWSINRKMTRTTFIYIKTSGGSTKSIKITVKK